MASSGDMTVVPVMMRAQDIQSVFTCCDIEIFWASVPYSFSGLFIIYKILVFIYRLPTYLKVTKPCMPSGCSEAACIASMQSMPCCIHKIIIFQVYKVRMSPSAYFKAADVVNDNIILIAYAHSGFQAAVVINRHEWDTRKQVMIQTCQPGDACLTIESFRCNGCREQGWELVPVDPSHVMSDLCSRAKQAFETYLTEQWMP